MKILYSLPHPADSLDSEQAGHTVRARAMLGALETLGHDIIRLEAASNPRSQSAVKTYRSVVKKLLPRPVAQRMRDLARVAYSRNYGARLIEAIHQHQPDVILETHIAFSVAGKMASAQTGIPLILDDVAPSWEEEQQYGVGAKQLALNTHREVTQQASLLVAVSGVIRQHLIDERIAENKIITVHNGINAAKFHTGIDSLAIRNRYHIPADAVVIVFVGSFQPYHRVDLLIEAFAHVKTDAYLFLVGDGQRRPEAKALCEKLGLTERVIFTGRIPYEQVADYSAVGDIAIMPATNSYGNPMKIYEYMALGQAVLAPRQETITEIVTHAQDAYLFEPENVGAITEALERVIVDGELRHRLGQSAAQQAIHFTWEARAKSLEAAIGKIREL